MTPSSSSPVKSQITSKIHFLENQLVSLDHYLPETNEYLMAELDVQRRQLAQIEVQETFQQINSDQWHQAPSGPHPASSRGHRAPNKKHPEPNL